ncbi:MAG: phage holin family protein [Clostridium perfringens]|nr:phage holin family protein [Clostridium perfringens]
MKKLVVNLLVSALSLYICSNFLSSMYIGSIGTLIILSIVIGALNNTIKPIMKLFSLPITILTFGLFSLVINAIVLKIAFFLVPNASLYGFFNAIIASILLSLFNWILYGLFK